LWGPIWWIGPLIFPIELISNFIRPFRSAYVIWEHVADEKVVHTVSSLAPQLPWLGPLVLMR